MGSFLQPDEELPVSMRQTWQVGVSLNCSVIEIGKLLRLLESFKVSVVPLCSFLATADQDRELCTIQCSAFRMTHWQELLKYES
jgi:hypothetical protein